MRFKKVKSNDWQQPVKHNYKLVCCDCGLVHSMDFRSVLDKKGKPHVQFRARRANGITRQWRKQQGIRASNQTRPD